MVRKKWNRINRLLVFVIILCITMCMHIIVFGKQYELSEDDELNEIINYLVDWHANNLNATAKDMAEQILTICNNDPKKIERLQLNYIGDVEWNGGSTDGMHKAAVDLAIDAAKEKRPIPDGNDEQKQNLRNEIISMVGIANDSNASIDQLKDLNSKLHQYRLDYGFDSREDADLILIANQVRDNLNSKGNTDSTVADDVDKREEERKEYEEEQENKQHAVLGSMDASTTHTPDEIINEGNQFIEQASGTTIGGDNLQEASSSLYNILLSIGIFLAVAIGMYLGVKFMVSTAEDKAKVKEALIPYIAGCVVIFSAFIIWKFAILLLNGIA